MAEAAVLAPLGWLVSPVLNKLFNKAYDLLGTGINERRKKLEALALPTLSLAIEKAEKDPKKELEDWFRRLKDAYYGAEEAIDLLEYEKLKQKVKDDRKTLNERGTPISLPLNCVPPIKNGLDKLKYGLSVFSAQKKMLKGCIDNLIEIAEEAKDFRHLLGGPENVNGSDADSNRETPSDHVGRVFGREKDKEKVVSLLTKKQSNSMPGTSTRPAIPIIAITGRPGVGKTALAQYVYEHMDGQEHFNLCVWVHVPHKFVAPDVIKNMIQIIKKTKGGKNDPASTPLQALSIELKSMLRSKKLLLVLDDFWSVTEDFVDQWKNFIGSLSSCSPESRILLTTQLKNAPQNAGIADVTEVETYNIEEIEGGPFFDLFMHHAWPSNCHLSKEEFQKIGQKIAVKLKGDPGAAKLVGGQLSGKLDLRHWEETTEKDWLGDNMKSRMWSYQQLSLDLQRCFAFCSFFPKASFPIQGTILIAFWMAEGFVRTNDNEERLEDIGEKYLQELVSRSFLEQIAEKEVCYQLHDLFYDLAERVQGDDLIRIDSSGEIPSRLNENTRHISLPSSMINQLLEKKCFLENVRTFRVEDDGGFEMKVLEEILKHMKKLRVLELHKCSGKLPESIGNLKHLRLLLFRYDFGPLNELPNSICELYHLKTLVLLANCESLPNKISELISLRDLVLSNETFPHISHVGRLASLQSLHLFVVRKERGHELHQLKNLNQLRGSICIQGLENVGSTDDAVKANMLNKKHLEEVRFEWKSDERDTEDVIGLTTQHQLLEALRPHRNVSAVTLIGFGVVMLPTWLFFPDSLPKCRKLVLRGLKNLRELLVLPPNLPQNLIELISLPPNLTHFEISSCNITSEALSTSIQYLVSLSKLELSNILTITSLPPREVLNSLKNLMSLTIKECFMLSSLGGLGDVTSLKVLILINCFSLNPSNEPLASSLETLAIVLPSSMEMEMLTSFSCSKIDVTCALNVGSLSHLKELKIAGWAGRLEGLNSLNALHFLGVVNCPGINRSIKMDKYTSQLHEATFDYLFQLKLILSDESISSIKRLKICNFQGDSSDDEVFQSLTSLKELSFASFNGTHLPKNLKNLASVSSMEIVDCPNLCELELEELPRNLLRLEIEECPTLTEKVNKGGPYLVRHFEGRTTLTFPTVEGKETFLGFIQTFLTEEERNSF